jgi:hypothetical protein
MVNYRGRGNAAGMGAGYPELWLHLARTRLVGAPHVDPVRRRDHTSIGDGIIRAAKLGLPFWVTAICVCLAFVLMVFAAMRLSLAFPAAAIGDRSALKTSWHATSGNFWRLFAASFLSALPILLIGLLSGILLLAPLKIIMAGQTPGHLPLALQLIGAVESGLLRTIQSAQMAAMLSLSYDILVRKN